MPQGDIPPGSSAWLATWVLDSLQRLDRSVAELAGLVRSHHEATNRRIDDFRDEAVGRLGRLEERVQRGEVRRAAALWHLVRALPWWRILSLGGLLAMGLLGHVGVADWVRWLSGR